MNTTSTTPSLFTFGCMSLGSDFSKIDEHIRITRTAMDGGGWFHASPTYNRGFTYMILRMAFDEARDKVPPMIIKIRCDWPTLVRFEVEDTLRRLGIGHIDVAQLVFTETGGSAKFTQDFSGHGPVAKACDDLRREGKVLQFCPQIDLESSPPFLPLVQRKMFDGYVLYLSPIEHDVDHALWSVLQKQGEPLWALRTVAGALGEPAQLEKLRAKNPSDPNIRIAERMIQISKKAGIPDWTEFCVRYSAGVPHLKTTIGGTANLAHLEHFLSLAREATPLPLDVMTEIASVRKSVA